MNAIPTPGGEITALRQQIFQNGWLPLPVTSPDYQHEKVKSPGKQPFFKGWNSVSADTISVEMIVGWAAILNHTNTGLICGLLLGLDLDIPEPVLAARVAALADVFLGPTPLVRVGKAPKSLRCYRHAAPLAKRETPELFLPDGTKCQVEAMGAGQQVVGFGIHPATHAPYQWSGVTPADMPFMEVPVVEESALMAFLTAAEAAMRAAGGLTEKELEAKAKPEPEPKTASNGPAAGGLGSGPKSNTGDSFFKQVNRAALDNLSGWVPRLFPRAVSTTIAGKSAYRVPSADLGREYEEDLSIHSDGIQDFGPRKKLSPIDVMMTWGGAPNAQQAALTLCEWLGRSPADLGWNDTRKVKPEKAGAELADGNGLITEGAVADAFATAHVNQLRFDHTAGRWFLWDGTRWRREETKLAYRWAHARAKQLAADTENAKVILAAGKASFAAGVERLAQSDRTFAVTHEIWDRDPWLLGTPGGTVDLRTGQIRPAAREDYVTKLAGVAPAAPGTPHPIWSKFLDEATKGDQELQRFLQQMAGYCLTGDTREHALFFVHGPGKNGKSVFLNVLAGILGDYGTNAAMDTFTASQSDRHPTDLAKLAGARLVTATETEEGRAWAEAKIKQMTGGDIVSARFMRQDFFDFRPQFKLLVVGNHKPVLQNVDEAARRRVNMIPFTHTPPVPDRNLDEKLRAEWTAILAWAIAGAMDWQKNGLLRPAVVLAATEEYFSEQDLANRWIEECCERGDRRIFDTAANLFASWKDYAVANGEVPKTSKWLAEVLKRHGAEPVRDTPGSRNRRGYLRISVRLLDTAGQWQNAGT